MKEGGKEGRKEGGRKEGGREGGKEGRREGGREGGKEGRKEGSKQASKQARGSDKDKHTYRASRRDVDLALQLELSTSNPREASEAAHLAGLACRTTSSQKTERAGPRRELGAEQMRATARVPHPGTRRPGAQRLVAATTPGARGSRLRRPRRGRVPPSTDGHVAQRPSKADPSEVAAGQGIQANGRKAARPQSSTGGDTWKGLGRTRLTHTRPGQHARGDPVCATGAREAAHEHPRTRRTRQEGAPLRGRGRGGAAPTAGGGSRGEKTS